MKKNIYNTGLITMMVILSLTNVNKAMAQKAMAVMSSKIMQPYQETVKTGPAVKIGIGAETYGSGTAHGAFYCATINLSKKRSIFSFGPCLQKRSLELNGLKLGYSVALSGSNDRYDEDELKEMEKVKQPEILELRLRFFTQYTHNAKLSYNASRVETITNPESTINYYNARFSTIELAVCPELIVTYKNVKLRTYAGFTTFYHFKHAETMYRPKFSPALVFGVGILIPEL